MWEQEFLDELCAYVGFTPDHARALLSARPLVESAFPAIVDKFYDAIMKNGRAMTVFTGGVAQIERQKAFLSEWLKGVFSGVYDVEYLKLRARIGRTHVRIRLDQSYMISEMNLVREGLHQALSTAPMPEAERRLTHDAIDKICDLELAIMLETYSEDYSARMRDKERLATLGQLAGFIGHELRNPLAVIETSLHLLKKRVPADDENASRHMRRLGEQVAVSSGIISDLLELARDRAIERHDVDLKPLAEDVVARLPGTEGVQITIDVPQDFGPVSVDDKQIRHLLTNLLTNACQAVHSKAGASNVWLRAQRDGDSVLLIVEDDGPGIAEEVRHRLFEPLSTTRAKGLGLGLALCRRIAEKHDGEIRAETRPSGGARFVVRLPYPVRVA